MALTGTWVNQDDSAVAVYVGLPAVLCGSDVTVNLSGPTDPQAWTLASYAAYAPDGTAVALSGLSVAAVSSTVIRLTLTAACTDSLTLPDDSSRGILYLEVWRTDAGSTYPLRRLALPFYAAVRG
jgi:hypothetical protein